MIESMNVTTCAKTCIAGVHGWIAAMVCFQQLSQKKSTCCGNRPSAGQTHHMADWQLTAATAATYDRLLLYMLLHLKLVIKLVIGTLISDVPDVETAAVQTHHRLLYHRQVQQPQTQPAAATEASYCRTQSRRSSAVGQVQAKAAAMNQLPSRTIMYTTCRAGSSSMWPRRELACQEKYACTVSGNKLCLEGGQRDPTGFPMLVSAWC